jgi:hypothetical protein
VGRMKEIMRVGEPTRVLVVDMVESGIELGDQGCRGVMSIEELRG